MRRCPNCKSNRVEKINTGAQVLEGVGRFVGYGFSIFWGHPNAGKRLFAGPISTKNRYRCTRCNNEWEEE